MADVRNARFFRWYRTLPLLMVAAMLALSLGVNLLPINVARSLFFPVSYAERIDDASARYGVDPHLVSAVIRCESGWNESAISTAGAVGLMQIMPETARSVADMGVVDTNHFNPNELIDPATNIEYGCALLSYLQTQLPESDQVIAAYNAGLATAEAWKQTQEAQGSTFIEAISYAQTRHYVDRVNEAWRQYARYYPDGMSVL